jgi:hypothetical protein
MNNSNGYSSTVRGWLEAGGHRFPLAQVGPNFCIIRDNVTTPPTGAELVIEVDGDERRKRVFLPAGISESFTVVEFAHE